MRDQSTQSKSHLAQRQQATTDREEERVPERRLQLHFDHSRCDDRRRRQNRDESRQDNDGGHSHR